MSTATQPSIPRVGSIAVRPWQPLSYFALFAVGWADLIRQLSYTWGTREQYSYGWLVPLFGAYLFWRRWQDRPAPGHPSSRAWLTWVMVCLTVLLVPLRVIFEINADWPLMGWLYTTLMVGLTLYALFLAGGMAWTRHFAFPVGFILVAVTWPYRIEKELTQGLMQAVAGITVEVLGVLGMPALQRGSLIELSGGVVGVDDACSGVRSFQSTLMGSLLMGELYRLRLMPRFALVGSGLAMAFIFNNVRTLLLSWQADKHGIGVIAQWHDPAGLSIVVVVFLCLWGMAEWIKSRFATSPGARPATLTPWLPPTRCLGWIGWVGCWSVVALVGTEVWYRSHDAGDRGEFQWTMAFPTNNPSYKPLELSPRTLSLLRHDEGGAASWKQEDGSEWSAYFLRWNPRSVQAVIQSRLHRPDVCLPAAGLRQVGESRLLWLDAGGRTLPFRTYTYELAGQLAFVFFCQWEDGSTTQDGMRATKQGDRLQSVRSGRRRVGQQTLELILTACPSIERAEALVRNNLARLIRFQP